MSTSTPIIAAEEDQTNIPLSERKLSSLTDLEILELTQSIKAADANLRPLIGELESISALSEEYEGATTYLLKIKSLEEQGWKGIRRSRGDGDCFYRSLAFCYVERLLNESTQKAKDTLDSLNNLLPLLYQANFQKDIVQDFFEPFVSLLESLGPSPSTPRLISATLLQSFNDPEISNSIVVFLRLLTSAYLRANKDDFEPFMFSLEDDPRFFEGGVPTLEMFCGYHVEASSKEADRKSLFLSLFELLIVV